MRTNTHLLCLQNTATTVKACVTFFRLLNSPKTALVPSNASASAVSRPLSASAALLSGGGKENGEDPRNPFLREYPTPAPGT